MGSATYKEPAKKHLRVEVRHPWNLLGKFDEAPVIIIENIMTDEVEVHPAEFFGMVANNDSKPAVTIAGTSYQGRLRSFFESVWNPSSLKLST